MAPTSKTKSIVVGYDFSAPADAALERGLQLALSSPGTDLHIIGVLDAAHGPERWRADGASPLAGNQPDYEAARQVHDELQSVVRGKLEARESPHVRVFVHARIGHPVHEILALAAETGAELIVVGTHGRERLQRWLLGSVAERLARHAHCSVLVAREERYPAQPAKRFAPEPPCPDCEQKRRDSDGRIWWCEAHSGHRLQPHIYGVPHDQATIGSFLWFQ